MLDPRTGGRVVVVGCAVVVINEDVVVTGAEFGELQPARPRTKTINAATPTHALRGVLIPHSLADR